ncbi:conserved hypothetical protein [Ricinus communis]|uniref:Uncharacterized protein n=1 Tax=Ricinus communis TaxID=3988 RepID=B9RIK7_RICCO|nr:conserved hypothetical protein [Ricinus communis]
MGRLPSSLPPQTGSFPWKAHNLELSSKTNYEQALIGGSVPATSFLMFHRIQLPIPQSSL